MPRTDSGKRERLVDAATTLFWHQGAERTTLAALAEAADVPLGNIYYYFRTKDQLITAVIEKRAADLRATLSAIESADTDPRSRLETLIRTLTDHRQEIAQFGCPYGTLATELLKTSPTGHGAVSDLLAIPTDWAREQFELLGRRDAHELATRMIAGYQGAAVMTHVYRCPEHLASAARAAIEQLASV